MNPIRVFARPLLASVFIVDAVDALRHTEDHVAKMAPVDGVIEKVTDAVPSLPKNRRTLVRLHAGVTLAAGLCFALGKAPRTSATLLALTSLPAAVVAHPVRTKAQREENLSGLLAKAAAIAGLAFAAADRQGAPSLGWRYHNWQDHRAELAEAKVTAAQ